MKTFTSIKAFPVGSSGHDKGMKRIYLIEADPKREGLYKMSEFQVKSGAKPKRFSLYYGKCNQAKILEESKSMIEVI